MSKPTIKYWHVWTDKDGISHQTQCELTNFEQESMGGDADPQWNDHLLKNSDEVMFSVLPVGWKGEWHKNSKPQWVVPLSGKWFVETMDGTRIEMGAGEFSFGGDRGTKPNERNKGHLSGTVGDEPAVLTIVQLDDKWSKAQPGDFT